MLHTIAFQPTDRVLHGDFSDIGEASRFLLDGYENASSSGFLYTKDKGNVIEVLEIEGQQFRRHIPAPPLHSKLSFFYSPADVSTFPCCNYQDRILLTGPLEEDRVLQQRFSLALH